MILTEAIFNSKGYMVSPHRFKLMFWNCYVKSLNDFDSGVAKISWLVRTLISFFLPTFVRGLGYHFKKLKKSENPLKNESLIYGTEG